jgi:hypothetical protein
MSYNFGRAHQTLRVTPAMEAGGADAPTTETCYFCERVFALKYTVCGWLDHEEEEQEGP